MKKKLFRLLMLSETQKKTQKQNKKKEIIYLNAT